MIEDHIAGNIEIGKILQRTEDGFDVDFPDLIDEIFSSDQIGLSGK